MQYRVVTLTIPYLSDRKNPGITRKIDAFIAEVNQAQAETVVRFSIGVLPLDVRPCLNHLIEKLPMHVVGVDCTGWEPNVYDELSGAYIQHPTAISMLVSLLPPRITYLNLSALSCTDAVLVDVLTQVPFKQLKCCNLSDLNLGSGGVLDALHQVIEQHDSLAQLSALDLSCNDLSQVDSVQMSEFMFALFILCPDITVNLGGNYLQHIDEAWYLPGPCYFVELLGSMVEYNKRFNGRVKLEFDIPLRELAVLVARRDLLTINQSSSSYTQAFLAPYSNLHVDLTGCIDEQIISFTYRDVYAVFSKAYHLGVSVVWEPKYQLYFLLNHLSCFLEQSPREFLAECRRLPFSALPDVVTRQFIACGERALEQRHQFVRFESQVAVAMLLPGLLLLGCIKNISCRQKFDDADVHRIVLEGRIHAGITSLMQVGTLLRSEIERPSRAMHAHPEFEVPFLFSYHLAQKLVERIFNSSPLRSVKRRYERLRSPSPLDSVYWQSRLWSSNSTAVAASSEWSHDDHLPNLMA